MESIKDNRDIACYFITKHSWKGKYKRIFSVGTHGITTYNLNTLEITNRWPYSDFISIVPNNKAPTNNEFSITMRKGQRKVDTMRFSTDHRPDLLTEALRFRKLFAEQNTNIKRFNAFKYHWSETRVTVILEVNSASLDQLDPVTNRLLASYDYKDMEGLTLMSDYPGGVAVVYGGNSRLHLFVLDQRDQLVKSVMEAAANNIGISVKCQKEAITFDHFLSHKFGNFSSDECLTSYTEFTVQKISPRHTDCVRRTLCLTENCLVERDPATYNVVTCKPLCDIFAIIRYNENPQRFSVEYVKGEVRTYQSTDRDALLASLLDGVRASGNRDVCVKMSATKRGYRLGPFTVPVDEEVESQHLRFIHSPPTTMSHHEAVERFNCNTSYSGLMHAVTQDGLFAENKEKLINAALSGLLGREGDQANNVSSEALEAEFQALRRLVASKAGFQAFTSLPKMRERVGVKVVKALKRNDDAVTHAAVDMLCALMQPMHDDYDIRQEQMNKYSLMSSRKFLESLLEMFNYHVVHATGALVISSMLDFLTFALCAPYSETTEGAHFDTMLEMVAANGRIVFKLFQHPSMAIVKGAGLVMKAIIEEGDAEIAAKMQDLALGEGALPKHLHTAMFTQGADSRMLTNRQLSRHLVGLWVTGHPTAMHLLGRIMPSGLLAYLDSTDEVPTVEEDKLHVRDNVKLAQDRQNRHKKNPQLQLIEKKIDHFLQHWRAQMGLESSKKQNDVKPIVLRKRRQRIKSEANWLLFYYHFNHDHARPNLIWNYKTREELREALENEMRSFNVDRELGSNHVIAWNHQEFEVPFNCLSDEIKIGDYYLRLLLEEGEESTETLGIKRSYEFFNDLYHRFLLTTKTPMKCMCLQAMAIVYGKCHQEIGPFNDTRYIIGMLDRCTDRLERDRLILFINKLILHTKNIKEILDSNGIKILVDLLTLAHLHTSRAVVPLQSNLLEAGVDMKRESEKEWYYGNADKERLGPYSYEEMKALWNDNVINGKTRCWAQGMDGWRSLQCVTQLKWKLLATSQPVMNETELAKLILSMLIRIVEHYPSRDIDGAIVRPLPRAKRLLSDATSLPHIVQLLLTFDPALVERVAILLYEVMQDNPNVSRLYLTGVFYFIMMYTGCNVLPVARFLKYTHLKQAFRSEENKTSDIMVRSVMGHLLPEAMVCYLENYSAERFAEIFLGEFDTPEAIWSNEMRRMMIEKIASHLADFSPRLQSNTRALYQYCPIPVISFPQLENELFCNIYYLKHLCDTMNFPDWPIKDPVRLLKDILDAWKKEVEKKPPSMSVEEAYQVLNLNKAPLGHDESKVRKAYFRLAQKYHPDKNPDGREMFEKVNKAYEFLCSKKKKATQGPDPENIVLILKAQSILFKRHKNVLEPYKYAGYPMLIKTIKMETQDETLFSKSAPLLAAASETAYYTVNCSALNAEELRRENGIEALQDAFTRCVDVLSLSTTPDDVAAQVCMHVTQCYSVASQFEGCREKIQEMACIIRDLTKILFYKNLQNLCSEVAACISSFCIDYWLQTHLYQAGVIWSLLLYMFQYDYTLAESGIEKSKDSNQQEESNQLACLCVVACARLAGYNSTNDENPCPDNPAVKKSLLAMLTPYLARKLANENPFELLKLLNSNTENPYLIWNNSTRTQLSEYLTDQQSKKKWYLDSSFSADHFLKIAEMGECDPDYGSKFVFKEHEKELIVGEIFVRVYNDQPTFVLENPKGFTIDLLDFLGSEAQYLYSLMALQQQNRSFGSGQGSSDRLRNVEMALEALRNVIRNNPGVEIQCIGHFKLLFSLLRLENCAKLQQCTLEVINSVTTNQECVNDIAASEILSYLLLAIQGLPQCHLLILETLFALMSNTKIVKEALSKGALVYLLDLFCNSTNPLVREKTSELFAKMLGDKLVGPKVRIILAKFLPGIFMDAMRDSPDASVHMFEGTHENPELIWNDDAREKVCDLIKKLKAQHYRSQRDNPDTRWSLPDDFSMVYSDVQGELAIGGVFLRLFIANPGWVLRKPKEFLTELMEKWVRLLEERSPDGEVLETVTMALVCLFQSQVPLLDQVPGLGYIPHIFQVMHSKNPAIPKSAIQVLNQLTNSELCIRSMSAIDCIGSLKIGMKCRKDMMVFAAECLAKMFEKAEEELVSQALKHEMIPFLLSVLQNPLESTENPAATKAQIVKALKCMQRSLLYGEQVTSLLEKSAVWKEYKDQKHDLFLSDTSISGYLTGPGVAGYLTSGVRPNLPDAPPPLDTSHQEDFH